MRGFSGGVRGTERIRRSSVSGLVGMARVVAKRAPPSPPIASATRRKAARRPWLRRAWGATNPAKRSVKMRRAQVGMRQKNLRTRICSTTATPASGRSATMRW